MELAADQETAYENAVKKLFPSGDWWDGQFADPGSDLSMPAGEKAAEISRFRNRMRALFDESRTETTLETLDDWERVLLDGTNSGGTTGERRNLLKSRENGRLNRGELDGVAARFGLAVRAVDFPFRPGFFGFSKFALERTAGFAAFSAARFSCTDPDFSRHLLAIKAEMEKCRFASFRPGTDRLAHFPVGKMREVVCKKARRGCFGHGRPPQNRLADFPLDEARRVANGKLDGKRMARIRFGRDRGVFFDGRFPPDLSADRDLFAKTAADALNEFRFKERFDAALAGHYLCNKKPYAEFERATGEKLLAGHIPIFEYGGE